MKWKNLGLVLGIFVPFFGSPAFSKEAFVGPGQAFSTILAAVNAHIPLIENLYIYVVMPTLNYSTPEIIAPTANELNGFSIKVTGLSTPPTMTVYVDGHAVYEGQTALTLSYENISGPNGQEGRIAGGSPKFLIKDHLGSTRTSMDVNGAYIDQTMFYSYGNMHKLVTSSNDSREKFTTKEFDSEGGLDGRINLIYFGARYYEPELGMWISPDPLRQYNSPYTYVGNNPVNLVDPTGLAGEEDDEAEGEAGPFGVLDIMRAVDSFIQWAAGVSPGNYNQMETNEAGEQVRAQSQASGRTGGVPEHFVESESQKGGGVRYTNPVNRFEVVRVMPGNPNSPNPAQQTPYVSHALNGGAFNAEGYRVEPDATAAHIPVEQYIYRPNYIK